MRPARAALRRAIGLTLGALLLIPVTAPIAHAASDVPAGLESYYSQQLTWAPCSSSSSRDDRKRCAWVTVPLDYANPAGDTIRLRVARWAATGAHRVGSLLVNPGGPGASGISFGGYVAASSKDLAAAYDIIGWDTRGVGESAPITCMTGRQTTTYLRTDDTPMTPAQEQAYLAQQNLLAQGCLTMSPTVARHVGTENTVRDMDILRAVLGDAQLNWLGASYGTYLGEQYLQAFPTHVGRMVLDGVVDPSFDSITLSKGQSDGFQTALVRFAADCARTSATCPWRSQAAVIAGINAILDGLGRRPMPTATSKPLVQAEGINAVLYAMYSPYLWPDLRDALAQAKRGNGTGLRLMSAEANDQTGPDTYATNMASAFPAIGCWDMPATPGVDGSRAIAAQWSNGARFPEVARVLAWGNLVCSVWYGHTSTPPHPVTTTTTAPVLLVGSTYDPATPYTWAQAVRRQIATSVLLTRVGDGHTGYGSGSACTDKAITTYLVSGTLPADGTVCR